MLPVLSHVLNKVTSSKFCHIIKSFGILLEVKKFCFLNLKKSFDLIFGFLFEFVFIIILIYQNFKYLQSIKIKNFLSRNSEGSKP